MTPKPTLIGLLTACLLAACTAKQTPTQSVPTNIPTQPAASTPLASATPAPATATPSPAPTETAVPTATLAPTATPTSTTVPSITPIPTLIVDTFGLPMVLVPAGPFLMGSDTWNDNERPPHTVNLDAFYIDQFEVSNASFAEFLNANGNQIEGYAPWVEEVDPDLRVHRVDGIWMPDEGYADHPINEATWYAARAYCAWRETRLPSEAEWEKAARGDDGRTFPWGEDEPTCELANFAGCFYDSVPVDSYPNAVSPYGAYNMAGNVMEWVADWYVSPYDTTVSDNPTGPENGDFRIFRGGAWFNSPYQVRTTFRFAKLPVLTFKANGFRCARDAVP